MDEVLGPVGLADAADRHAGGYSLGMRQRLGLATALLGEPEVLVLDEPANGLDPQGVRWLRDLLGHYAELGATVLVSSHLLNEMALIAEEVVVIRDGRLVTHDRVEAVTRGGGTSVLVSGPDLGALVAALEDRGATAQTGRRQVDRGPRTSTRPPSAGSPTSWTSSCTSSRPAPPASRTPSSS